MYSRSGQYVTKDPRHGVFAQTNAACDLNTEHKQSPSHQQASHVRKLTIREHPGGSSAGLVLRAFPGNTGAKSTQGDNRSTHQTDKSR